MSSMGVHACPHATLDVWKKKMSEFLTSAISSWPLPCFRPPTTKRTTVNVNLHAKHTQKHVHKRNHIKKAVMKGHTFHNVGIIVSPNTIF